MTEEGQDGLWRRLYMARRLDSKLAEVLYGLSREELEAMMEARRGLFRTEGFELAKGTAKERPKKGGAGKAGAGEYDTWRLEWAPRGFGGGA